MTPNASRNNVPTPVQIAMICDRHVVIAATVALFSLKRSTNKGTQVSIGIVCIDLLPEDRDRIAQLSDQNFCIRFLEPINSFQITHRPSKNSIASANSAALQKFWLPELFPAQDIILYLDCDILVKTDLEALYRQEIGEHLAAVVADSGQLYIDSVAIRGVERYFNSGVLLLNLAEMRKQKTSEQLIDFKKEKCDGNLVDQNAFNYVFNGKVKYLSVRYNCLCVNIERARQKIKIDRFNALYGENFSDLDQAIESASILHFASNDKPWKFSDVKCADEWFDAFSHAGLEIPASKLPPQISIIIPIFNLEKYLNDCLSSFAEERSLALEIILVNDGSSDRSGAVADAWSRRDGRVRLLEQANSGQSAARNTGFSAASGEFVYFLDGDDMLKAGALQELYLFAKGNQLDILYFNGETIFDSDDLEVDFQRYKEYYNRNMPESSVMTGAELLLLQAKFKAIKPSVCLQLFRRSFLSDKALSFLEGATYEDNLFSLQAALSAERCAYLDEAWFIRRVRNGSTMTSKESRKSYLSYIRVVAGVVRVGNLSIASSEELQSVVRYIFLGMLRAATEVFASLSASDRKAIEFDPRGEEILLHESIRMSFAAKDSVLEKRYQALAAEHSAVTAKLSDARAKLSDARAKLALRDAAIASDFKVKLIAGVCLYLLLLIFGVLAFLN